MVISSSLFFFLILVCIFDKMTWMYHILDGFTQACNYKTSVAKGLPFLDPSHKSDCITFHFVRQYLLFKRYKHIPRIKVGIGSLLILVLIFVVLLLVNKYIAAIVFGLTLLFFFYYMALVALVIIVLFSVGSDITGVQLSHNKLLARKKTELCGVQNICLEGTDERLDAAISYLQTNDEILSIWGFQLTNTTLASVAGVAVTGGTPQRRHR